MAANDSAYVLDPTLHNDLATVATKLNIPPEEVMRRAIELYKYAASADSVELVQSNGEKQSVKVK